MKDLMNNYEQSHEYVLLINGKDYRQLIADQWANREMSKEKEKLQKVTLSLYLVWELLFNFRNNSSRIKT